jgi:hypothetical protein
VHLVITACAILIIIRISPLPLAPFFDLLNGDAGETPPFFVVAQFRLPPAHSGLKRVFPKPNVRAILIGSLRYPGITLRRSDASLIEVIHARMLGAQESRSQLPFSVI